jgi:hypothetical protein
MRVMLAGLVWLLSSLLSCSSAQTFSYLTQKQLRDAQFVSDWLKTNISNLDQKGATTYFNLGMKYKKEKYWSAAAKSFGESAIRYPSPQALIHYAQANSLSLSAARAREKSTDQFKLADMRSALQIYKSASAADAVLNTLSSVEKNQLQANIGCLNTFVETEGKPQKNCAPLMSYGALRSR